SSRLRSARQRAVPSGSCASQARSVSTSRSSAGTLAGAETAVSGTPAPASRKTPPSGTPPSGHAPSSPRSARSASSDSSCPSTTHSPSRQRRGASPFSGVRAKPQGVRDIDAAPEYRKRDRRLPYAAFDTEVLIRVLLPETPKGGPSAHSASSTRSDISSERLRVVPEIVP